MSECLRIKVDLCLSELAVAAEEGEEEEVMDEDRLKAKSQRSHCELHKFLHNCKYNAKTNHQMRSTYQTPKRNTQNCTT
ncbi:uncharacterized protein Dmoj_GI25862 [Drosophila mojavensis]|uniref:Uncharacterized protein n=1 Tax=Drosophila mojavensis TaxID=7230 RepID=A0A0Q9X3D2_DROMO|nr:uncharacterized protein Dmoj_GI25862 [Drosophila mojavensis]